MLTYNKSKLIADNAKERKRERDRAQWQQQKDAINKRHREARHQRNKLHVIGTTGCNAS
jgi:hypothetical protein